VEIVVSRADRAYMEAMNDPIETQPGKPCPICGRPALTRFQPFCSRRCADVDLNRWLSGVYAVPGKEDEEEDGAPPTQDTRG
jgi:endogenous inhibitor of DNA gyrase (YacG/DUF329 family)